jgi:hypothetical protein
MSPLAVAVLVFACMLGGILLGMWLRGVLPEHHLGEDSKHVVTLGMGLLATMTALVLGLVTASATNAFDAQDTAIKHMAATTLELDRTLARYGPETQAVRDLIRQTLADRIEEVWPEDQAHAPRIEAEEAIPTGEGIEDSIRSLSPQTEAQRALKDRALAATADMLDSRWTVFGAAGSAIPASFLVIIAIWLSVLFWSFGLYAPRNATVLGALVVCAASVAASIFLILEMEHPLEGIVKLSSAPLRFTLEHLGK